MTLRYLALGDSYTIGEGVKDGERWPVQLARALTSGGTPVEAPTIIARTGWTTDELDRAITKEDPKGTWDLVTLLIGVNNQYRGRAAAEYRVELHALLARAVGFAGARTGRVILVSIPDWGVTPFAAGRDRAAIARAIDEFNAIGTDEARRAGVRFVDITPVSRESRPNWTTADGLHPSAAQYVAWVERILPVTRSALTQ